MDGCTVTRFHVIGIGSRLMCDDGIGPMLADALMNDLNKENIVSIAAETDVFYALSQIMTGDYIILLDAVVTGAIPGSVMVFELEDMDSAAELLSLHGMSLTGVLKWGANIAGACLIGIEAARIEPSYGLSSRLADDFGSIKSNVYKAILSVKESYPIG